MLVPALKSAGAALPASTEADILALEEACGRAHREWLLMADPAGNLPMPRARFVLDEIIAVLGWYFDGAAKDADDERLARLSDEHQETGSADAMAAALEDYAGLAAPYRSNLDGLGEFNAELLDEALALAHTLRGARAGIQGPSEESRAALGRRNRLLTLLDEKVRLVRSAAKFVYRNHPEIARGVTSAYERKKRAARRAANRKPEETVVKAAKGSGEE